MRIPSGILLALLLLPTPAASAEKTVPLSKLDLRMSFAPVVKQTSPAVVNVYARQMAASRKTGMFDDPFFRHFFGDDGSFGRPRERVQNSLGSGVIVDPSGIIVTNNHVILNGSQIRIVLTDKREFEAKVLLADERTDLAVLKIDTGGEELPALAFGDSESLEVGDLVLAIGNPFGVGQTVTSGIVSALARTQVGISDYQFFIQTDAAINPGNSGGALVNMAGELVGINTAIFSRSGGSIGIGFAIPAKMVETVVTSAENGGRILRPWLGADLQDVTADIAETLSLARPEGALVVALYPGSPLEVAGLKRGDIILSIDGKTVENAKELSYRVATATIGSNTAIEYQRAGTRAETTVAMIAAPETVERAETLIKGANPFAGLRVANLSPAVAEELGLPSFLNGVVAVKVEGGPARRFFKRGDVVTGLNGVPVDSVTALQQALVTDQGYWRIEIERAGRKLRFTVGG